MAIDPICGMRVNEQTALRLNDRGVIYYFCSKHCQEVYAKAQNISCELEPKTCCQTYFRPWYKTKTFIVAAIIAAILAAASFLPLLVPFRQVFLKFFYSVWWAIGLGLFLGGVVEYYVPREYMSYILARPRKRTILYAVVLGFFSSLCSHGILALSIQLHKKGAANSAVVAFLLASPWANVTITIMLFGFFGIKALFIICSALVIAIVTGFAFQVLERFGLIEANRNTVAVKSDFDLKTDIAKRIKQYHFSWIQLKKDLSGILVGTWSLADMVLWWVFIGMGIASLAGAYIPSHVFHQFFGPSFKGLITTLGLATVVEVCSEGSAPMAFEIYKQTAALGNAFVFLMAGVVTDYTEIGLLWHNVGRRVAVWLPIITVPQVVLLGYIANLFL